MKQILEKIRDGFINLAFIIVALMILTLPMQEYFLKVTDKGHTTFNVTIEKTNIEKILSGETSVVKIETVNMTKKRDNFYIIYIYLFGLVILTILASTFTHIISINLKGEKRNG